MEYSIHLVIKSSIFPPKCLSFSWRLHSYPGLRYIHITASLQSPTQYQKNVFSKPRLCHYFAWKLFMDSQTIKSQITTSCKPVSQQMCLSSQSILVSCQNPKLSPHQTVPTFSSPCCCICLLLCLQGPLSPSLPDHLLPFQRHILMFLRKGGILQLMSEGNCWLLGK